jgi:hypothetical protein
MEVWNCECLDHPGVRTQKIRGVAPFAMVLIQCLPDRLQVAHML